MRFTGLSERGGRFFPKHPEKYVGNPHNIIFRSSWERTFMEYCDRTPNIVRWASEELVIPYFFSGDGKWHRYYPDFVIHTKTTEGNMEVHMIEIKPYKQTIPPVIRASKKKRTQLREVVDYSKNQAKWQAARQFCHSKGWKFQVITERELYPKPVH